MEKELLKDSLTRYETSQKVQALAKTTRDGYRTALNDLLVFCTKAGVQFTEDVEIVLPKLAKSFKRKGLTDQSIYQKFTCIKIFLNWVGFPIKYTFHITNKEKKEFKVKHAKRWFDKSEIQKCLDYEFETGKNAVRDKLIVSLLIDTGCRAKELSHLKGVDIDLENGSLFLCDSKTEPRPAFFSPRSKELMEQLKEKLSDQWSAHLFPKVDRIKNIVCNMLLELGLKDGADGRGPHTFRHYFASNLFFIGDMRIEDVALLMGDTADTVRNVYLHCPVEILKEKTRKAMGWDLEALANTRRNYQGMGGNGRKTQAHMLDLVMVRSKTVRL